MVAKSGLLFKRTKQGKNLKDDNTLYMTP